MSLQKLNEIHIVTNYNKEFAYDDYVDYADGYTELIIQFLMYAKENILIQSDSYYFFIIKRGLETISHIFKFLFMYTKNFALTIHHCKKSFFYYTEFIGQIGDDNHTYLQLNSKDAILFVFKKTIFEINNKYRQNFNLTEVKDKEFLDFFLNYITIMNQLLFYSLSNKITMDEKDNAIYYCIEVPLKITKLIYSNKLSIRQTNNNIQIITLLFQMLQQRETKIDTMMIILRIFCKKLRKKKITYNHIKSKLADIKFDVICADYTPLRIVNSLFNIG